MEHLTNKEILGRMLQEGALILVSKLQARANAFENVVFGELFYRNSASTYFGRTQQNPDGTWSRTYSTYDRYDNKQEDRILKHIEIGEYCVIRTISGEIIWKDYLVEFDETPMFVIGNGLYSEEEIEGSLKNNKQSLLSNKYII